ncbi:MAG: hypothetical protein Q8M92_07785 [Candidatus Subteraquimicrobiales bacterium]|nr:hypothetical protein [Candidatus Subteraquimicrobiales bacterium]
MNLNPITALSDQLQKLINERGSAAILRDHLALFKDQIVLLEKENVQLRSENTVLTSKVEILQTENQQLTKDNEELRSKIQKYEQTSHSNLLDEIKVNILVLLSKYDKPDTKQIAHFLKAHEEIIKFHLTELENHKMIHSYLIMGAPARWGLTHAGRKYLIDNNLIS